MKEIKNGLYQLMNDPKYTVEIEDPTLLDNEIYDAIGYFAHEGFMLVPIDSIVNYIGMAEKFADLDETNRELVIQSIEKIGKMKITKKAGF